MLGWGRGTLVAVVAVALALTASAPAAAQAPPSSDCPTVAASCPQLSDPTPTEGQTLTVTNGTWSGSMPFAFAYQWQRCIDPSPGSCINIAGETGFNYVVAPSVAMAGDRLRALVTASNASGSSTQPSAISLAAFPTAAVLPGDTQTIAPMLIVLAPGSTAAPKVGDTVRAAEAVPPDANTDGWFNPAATTRSFRWRRCDATGALASCVDIPGPNDQNYVLTPADGERTIRVRLIGSNANGSKVAVSQPTAAITFPDRDGDGASLTIDCNDANPAIKPGALEIPGNGVDENCDGVDGSAGGTGLTLTLEAPKRAKSNKLAVEVSCSVACDVVAVAAVKKPKSRSKPASATLGAGETSKLALKFPRSKLNAIAAALEAGKRPKAKISVDATAAGTSDTETAQVKLRAPGSG